LNRDTRSVQVAKPLHPLTQLLPQYSGSGGSRFQSTTSTPANTTPAISSQMSRRLSIVRK
jgi:hypothetical protein